MWGKSVEFSAFLMTFPKLVRNIRIFVPAIKIRQFQSRKFIYDLICKRNILIFPPTHSAVFQSWKHKEDSIKIWISNITKWKRAKLSEGCQLKTSHGHKRDCLQPLNASLGDVIRKIISTRQMNKFEFIFIYWTKTWRRRLLKFILRWVCETNF